MSLKDKPSLKKLSLSTSHFLSSSQVITSVHSVIKELIENSLDASATRIDVKLVDCGLSKVEVRDDGIGVNPTDVMVMAKPHYTSKLSDENDIANCMTYGFRGEALSALCAVADVCITTKTQHSDVSFTYSFDSSGSVVNQKPSPQSQGTTVCCQNLLKNLPVRRKIWNSTKHKKDDLKKCEDLLKIFSVLHPAVRFSLSNENCFVWQKTSVSEVRAALIQAWGISVLQHMEEHALKDHRAEVELVAFLPKKSGNFQAVSKKSADACWIAVNKKPVKQHDITKILSHSVGNHWGNQAKGRYPICFLHFTLAPEKVDINLEPNKDRVFFHCKDSILNLISRLVDKAYGGDQENAQTNRHGQEILNERTGEEKDDNIYTTANANSNHPVKRSGTPLLASSSPAKISPLEGNLTDTNVNSTSIQGEICTLSSVLLHPMEKFKKNDSSESAKELDGHESLSLIEGLSDDDDDDDDFIKIPDYKILSENFKKNGDSQDKIQNFPEIKKNNLSADSQDKGRNFPEINKNNHEFNSKAKSRLQENMDNDCDSNVKISAKPSVVKRPTTPSVMDKANVLDHNDFSFNLKMNINLKDQNQFPEVGQFEEQSSIPTVSQINPNDLSCNLTTLNNNNNNNKNNNINNNESNKEGNCKELLSENNSEAYEGNLCGESLPKKPSEKWSLGHLTNKDAENIQPVKLITGGRTLQEKRSSSLVHRSPANQSKRLKVDHRQTKLDDLIASQTMKKPKNPFSYFCKDHRTAVVAANPDAKLSQITDILVDMFDQIPPEKKQEYKNMAEKNVLSVKAPTDKERMTKKSDDTSTKKENKLKRKELSVYFSWNNLKKHSQKTSESEPLPEIFLIGQLEGSGSWIGLLEGRKLVAMNHFRMKEALIYQKLKSSYELRTEPSLTPTLLDQRSLGSKELFQTLLSLPAEKINFTSHLHITDRRITANGFKISRTIDGDKVEITDCNQDLPYFGLNDLKEILQDIQSGHNTLELCRPRNVQHFLQGETVRMVRQMPPKLTDSEMKNLLHSCLALPENSRVCAHNKPFMHVIKCIDVTL